VNDKSLSLVALGLPVLALVVRRLIGLMIVGDAERTGRPVGEDAGAWTS
jgi:hypothetical protein